MSHAPSKKQFEAMKRRAEAAERDVQIATEMNEKAHARIKELEQAVHVAEKEGANLGRLATQRLNDAHVLARKIALRDDAILQLSLRLAEYGDPGTPTTIGETVG